MRIKFPSKEREIEAAILLLIDCVRQNCRNPKPLILHCLRVGMKLLELDQPKEVVIAGILHDLIEDTDCKISQIKKKFGQKVAKLVFACTQEDIDDYQERWHVLMKKIKRAGQGAMMIKIADAGSNLPYVLLMKDKEKIEQTLWKQRLILKELKPKLGDLEFFRAFEKKYEEVARALRNI